ncbi:TPA: hypothetical protein DEP21_01465 [Patescibacteria group bacterium]|nr:hypothetical protein [Candidatus Gracilibacteria bacterium]
MLLSIVLLIGFPYVLKAMGVQLEQEYNTKMVFSKAGELFTKVFEVGKLIKNAQKENEYRGNPYYDFDGTDSSTTSSYNL